MPSTASRTGLLTLTTSTASTKFPERSGFHNDHLQTTEKYRMNNPVHQVGDTPRETPILAHICARTFCRGPNLPPALCVLCVGHVPRTRASHTQLTPRMFPNRSQDWSPVVLRKGGGSSGGGRGSGASGGRGGKVSTERKSKRHNQHQTQRYVTTAARLPALTLI